MRLIPLQRFTLSFNRQKYSLQEGGFTLLEILVVLFLIVLIASLIGPKLVLKKIRDSRIFPEKLSPNPACSIGKLFQVKK